MCSRIAHHGMGHPWLAAGMTEAQILEEHPDLEKEDFPAVHQFAAEVGRRAKIS